jgi:hypothetical protein
MTFDELWRRDLARKGSPMHSGDTPEDAELFASRSPKGSAIDDLDEGEISRFLEWLERRLLSGDAREGSFQ